MSNFILAQLYIVFTNLMRIFSVVDNRPLSSAVLLVIFNIIIIYAIFNYNVSILMTLSSTPLYQAFKNPAFIYVGLILNVSTAIPTILDLFLAKFYHDKNFESEEDRSNESLIEMFILAGLNISIGSVVLLLRNHQHLPYIYACAHALQFVGSMGMVLLICKKLVPTFFTNAKIFSVQIFFSLASMTSMMGFGHSILYWPNIVTFFFIFVFFYILIGRICIPWLIDLRKRTVNGNETLSTKELCSLWYLMSTVVVLIFVPGVVATLKLYEWSSFDIWDVYVFVYSFAIYGIIVSTIPNSIARYAVDIERKNLVDRKRALIRYMSHELRSPLNVICSGMTFLSGDIDSLPTFSKKTNMLETLGTIRQATADVVQTTNDLMQLDSIDSGTFKIDEDIISCSELSKLAADACSEVSREKGISITVNNQFDQRRIAEERPFALPHDLIDIETGSDKVKESENIPCIFIDQQKIGQVVLNLVANAAKFTPQGQSIYVNFRLANSADLTEADSRMKELTATVLNGFSLCGHVVIEIADSLLEDHSHSQDWDKMFKQFTEFDVNRLLGGGDSGLGLWLCGQIVNLHGSEIRFHSGGEGCGARFYFTLPCYKKAAPMERAEQTLSAPMSILSNSIRSQTAQVSPEFATVNDTDEVTLRISGMVSRENFNDGECKVLVVDDSKANVKIVMRLIKQVADSYSQLPVGERRRDLESCDMQQLENRSCLNIQRPALKVNFTEADDGTEAVRMVQEAAAGGRSFDAVFMDNIMHRMHGPEAAQAMRSAGFKGLIVGVTGNVMPEDVQDYIKRGADYVIGKPVRINELRQILEKIF